MVDIDISMIRKPDLDEDRVYDLDYLFHFKNLEFFPAGCTNINDFEEVIPFCQKVKVRSLPSKSYINADVTYFYAFRIEYKMTFNGSGSSADQCSIVRDYFHKAIKDISDSHFYHLNPKVINDVMNQAGLQMCLPDNIGDYNFFYCEYK